MIHKTFGTNFLNFPETKNLFPRIFNFQKFMNFIRCNLLEMNNLNYLSK
jgi:hypothetical protein